jgi:hypothetical protein
MFNTKADVNNSGTIISRAIIPDHVGSLPPAVNGIQVSICPLKINF